MFREMFWDLGDRLRHRGAYEAAPLHAIYEWRSWHTFYVKEIVPRALRVRARLGEDADDVLRRVPEGVRSFLFHLDLTDSRRFVQRRARLLAALESRGIVTFNARIGDLRATAVQQRLKEAGLPHLLAERLGNPDELLMVKSNYNYGGRSERLLDGSHRRLLGLEEPLKSIRQKWDYFVRPRREIPGEIWRDARYAIQRFVTNAAGRLTRFRISLDHWVESPCVSAEPVKDVTRAAPEPDRFLLRSESPPEVRRAAAIFGLDFGSIDAVADDEGVYHVVDVNCTPGVTQNQPGRLEWLRQPWGGELASRRLA